MKVCKECGKEVEDENKRCPYCGTLFETAKPKINKKLIVIAVIVLAAVGIIYFNIQKNIQETQKEELLKQIEEATDEVNEKTAGYKAMTEASTRAHNVRDGVKIEVKYAYACSARTDDTSDGKYYVNVYGDITWDFNEITMTDRELFTVIYTENYEIVDYYGYDYLDDRDAITANEHKQHVQSLSGKFNGWDCTTVSL